MGNLFVGLSVEEMTDDRRAEFLGEVCNRDVDDIHQISEGNLCRLVEGATYWR